MKKNYTNPSIKVEEFKCENIVMTSGVVESSETQAKKALGQNGVETAYTAVITL